MKKATTPRGHSNLPVPKASKGSPGNAKSSLSKGGNIARSAEDIPRRVQLSVSGGASPRRAMSPGGVQRSSLATRGSPAPVQNGQAGVRYITEDLIRKLTKEDNLEMVTTLNLTLSKEGGKKIKYIENLDRMKRLQVLNLSNNIIEKIEKVDKLLKLKELNLSMNCITKIEGLENLTNLQLLNLTGNLIEHIPIWIGKRLKSLRAFHIGRNKLESLSELGKLKPLPDLTQLTVAENPLADLSHARLYLVFHLRTLEVIDGQQVQNKEREHAKNRFEQDELERLEKELEAGEAKFRRLEEDHNRSQQEKHHLSATEDDLRKREKNYNQRVQELERELETKNEILKKKTSELNKACEKHYALEQELAFYKIDSKFDSLGLGPQPSHEEGDDTGLIGESPYIGRARYKANRFAQESEVLGASPSQVQIQSVPQPGRAEVKMELTHKLDHEIAEKKQKVAKAEDRLKKLSDDLRQTEEKLLRATKDLKNIGDSAVQEKEDRKLQIRQKLARKMQTVNEMRDSATQIEDQVDKTRNALHQNKMDLARLKGQLNRVDSKDPSYRSMYADMVDKEQQINESNQMYGQLQDQLELMLDTIARETNDIKQLEQQLNEDQIESNETLREELDDIVGGLQTYLASVQGKAQKKEKEFDQLLKENESMQDRIRGLESELGVMDSEARNHSAMEKKIIELEKSLQNQEDQNRSLQEQVHRSQRMDAQNQDHMETKQLEIASFKKALNDAKNSDFIQKSEAVSQHTSRSRSEPRDGKFKPVDKNSDSFLRSIESQIIVGLPDTAEKNQKERSSKDPSYTLTMNKALQEIDDIDTPKLPRPKPISTTPKEKDTDVTSLTQALREVEKKAKADKQTLEKQLQTEKQKAAEGERKAKDAQKREEEIKKLTQQLEAVKSQNVSLRDRMDQDTSKLQRSLLESTPNTDLRRRLKDLSSNLKQGRISIEPENDKDYLGHTFKDLQSFVSDKMNKSFKDIEQTKSKLDKSDYENQSLRERLKDAEAKLAKRDDKVKKDKAKAKEDKRADEEEIKRQTAEIQRLKNALKEAQNRAKQGKTATKMIHAPDSGSEFSRRSSLNSEEKFLFDELQNELMTLKRAMRSKEEDASKKLLDAETEAAMLEQTIQDQEEGYQAELARLREHNEMQKERQEARMQVIAADLDQAQQVADFLQRMLDERENQLHNELYQTDMNNQMITTQEDELAKLYEILETQRDEIGRLNDMLDGLNGQGGVSLGTAGADDELWRLRQEVNNLKETLAMQSAYVQTMPPPALSAGVQASTGTGMGTGTQYFPDQGQAAGPTQRPILSQYKEPSMNLIPPLIARSSMGTSYAPPGMYPTPGAGLPAGVSAGVPVGISGGVSGGMPVMPGGIGAGGSGGGGGGGSPDPNSTGGADQREVKTPPGGRPSGGHSRHSQSPHKRHKDRGADADGMDRMSERSKSGRSGRSGRSKDERGRRKERGRHQEERPTAFEPVHKPQAYRPQMSAGPVNAYSVPVVAPGDGYGTQPGAVGQSGPFVTPAGGQMVGPGMMVGPDGQTQGPVFGPSGMMPAQQPYVAPVGAPVIGGAQVPQVPSAILKTSGISPTRPSHVGGTQSAGHVAQSGIGQQPLSGPPGSVPHGYMIPPGYNIPHPQGSQPAGGMGSQTPGYGATQTPSYTAGPSGHGGIPTQTPGHGTTQTPGYGAATQSSGFASMTPGHPSQPSVAMRTSGGQGPVQTQNFTASAQPVAYNSGRVFVPAYPTSPSRPPARVYYSGQGGGGGPPPPPPPPPPVAFAQGPPSPGPNVKFLPVAPLAEGTPITGHTLPRTSQNVSIPSPIRSVPTDGSPRRGVLKNMAQTGNDDTYLFCNVPEHHDLEDYIAELQEKLRLLKQRIAQEKELQALANEKEDYNLIRRLQGELAERRDELEGLDLAIERQQKHLKNMKQEEKQLQYEREAAREELSFMKDQNARRKRKVRVYSDEEDSFDERMENSRKKMLKDEIRCLELTLAKRKAQLREADRLLKECNTDLKCARDEARETVREYDKATHGLEGTIKETSELEKRANLAGVELVKAMEKLSALRNETKDYEHKRSKQEKLLKDITHLISKRDSEFKDVEGRYRNTQQNLTRLQNELAVTSQKEREAASTLRDSEDVLAKRRAEISRMRDQIEQQKHELEKVDHMMGKKRTELQFLQENVERKQSEINQLIRDTEAELSSNKRDIKEQRDLLRNFEIQKNDLNNALKNKRADLQKIRDDIEAEDEVLQKLTNTVNKHKSELKHTFEMQRLEQTELESLKSQHAQKLAELEKTQRALLDEKTDLEQLNSDANKKTAEVERLRAVIERDRQDTERLSMEKQSYEDRISTMMREKEMLEDTFKTLDTKVAQMRREHSSMEEKIDSTKRRLETLDSELKRREREMEEADRTKANLQNQIQSLKSTVKEGKNELKLIKEQIKDGEHRITHMEQELRDTNQQRDEAKLEMERVNESIRQSRLTQEDCLRQQRQREEELQDLIRTMDEREIEYQETRKALNKVRKEVEKEESKLTKLVSTANIELENIRTDLNSKQNELTQASSDIYNLKKEAEKLELNEAKLSELEKQIRNLNQELQDRNEEKNELAKALTRSYEELQKARTESAQEQEKYVIDKSQLENSLKDMQEQLEHAKKEMQHLQKRSSSQVTELQALAEEQFNRANKLSDELTRIKTKKQAKRLGRASVELLSSPRYPTDFQSHKLNDVTNSINTEGRPERPIEDKKESMPSSSEQSKRDKGQDPKTQESPPKTPRALDPGFRDYLDIITQPDAGLEITPQTEKTEFDLGFLDILTVDSGDSLDQSLSGPLTERLTEGNKENLGKPDQQKATALKEKLAREQDLLRLQLQQQMQRHADAMEEARLQSEGTIENLRKKLNSLQDVLVTTSDITSPTLRRARSRSAGLIPSPTRAGRARSPSPGLNRHSYLAQRPRSRSRSADRLRSHLIPDRDFLTV